MASLAALTARVLGIARSASAYSAMASCSREPSVSAKFSRAMERAASTAPPPGGGGVRGGLELRTWTVLYI